MRRPLNRAQQMVVAMIIAIVAAVLFASASSAQIPARTYLKPTPCTPRAQLFGRDTILALGPCADLAALEPHFRAQVECTLARMDTIGHWQHAKVIETWRSRERQQFLYAYGRTKPGHKVTNAKDNLTSVHGYAMAVDIAHSKTGWDDPKFFRSLAMHAEACGLVAGAFWTKFPDFPHVQFGAWQGAPPIWAQLIAKEKGHLAVWPVLFPEAAK